MLDLIQEIYGTIKRNKLRTALTGLSVSWGIFMLIVLLGAGNGLLHAFEGSSGNMKMNSMKIFPGYTSKPYKGLNESRRIILKGDDRKFTEEHFSENVITAGATTGKDNTILTYGKEKVTLTMNGVYPNYPDLEAFEMLRGRFINERDIREQSKVAVLHREPAETLFPKTDPLGKYVNAQGVIYRIVGIYDNFDTFSPTILIPFSTMQSVYNKGDTIDNLTFVTKGLTNEVKNTQFERDYRKAIGLKKQFAPTDEGAIWMWNRFSNYLQQQTATNILHIAIWVIGIFTLLSGIVGVSNIMLITVRERTHEFGIRKAIGAKPSSILWLIISESIAITTIFGYIGMVAGIGVTEYMNIVAGKEVMDIGVASVTVFKDPTVDMGIAIQATLTLIIAGTLAGLFPALKAIKIRPIDALRAN